MMDWRKILWRAVWTFIEGATGAVPVVTILADVEGWYIWANAAIVGGIASLVSFLRNLSAEQLAVAGRDVPPALS